MSAKDSIQKLNICPKNDFSCNVIIFTLLIDKILISIRVNIWESPRKGIIIGQGDELSRVNINSFPGPVGVY